MDFKPRTEQELAEMKLFPKGIYDFEILNAFEKLSKSSGKPMIELKIRVSDGNGSARVISDYLLEQRGEKLRHAAEACGLLDGYNTGCLADIDFRGKRGKLQLGIEKDKTKKYPDKNVVLDYVCGSAVSKGESGFRAFTQ